MKLERVRSTTILAVRRDGKVALGGDGQVTVGQTVMKSNAQKVRTLHGGKLLAGFAGAAADALAGARRRCVPVSEIKIDGIADALRGRCRREQNDRGNS